MPYKGDTCLGHSIPENYQSEEPHNWIILRPTVTKQTTEFYKEKCHNFINCNNQLYAFTLSPKSTPLMKHKSIVQQRAIVIKVLDEVFTEYEIDYFIVFELYKDLENIHCHGFIQIKYITHIAKIKRDLRQKFYKGNPPTTHKKCPLTHIQSQGIDNESRERWNEYLFKEQDEMIRNAYPPIWRSLIRDKP